MTQMSKHCAENDIKTDTGWEGVGWGESGRAKKTRAVRESDYSPAIALSEEKDKLV